jgi:hypothetical protein
MIAWKLRTWRSTAGATAALTALAACGGEGGAGGEADDSGEAGEAAMTAPPAPPSAAAPAAGGEAGEAGAASAYAGLSGDQLTALRLQHLKGFVMAAAAVNAQDMPAEAGVLVQQGLLEAYDPAPGEFGALDVDVIRAAAGGGLNRAQMMQRLRACEDEIDRASAALDVDGAVIVARMVDIATGLYQGVVQEDYVDPIEYQHSMGAALAAQSALLQHQRRLRRENLRAFSEAQGALNRFVALWPEAAAPERPTPYRDVLAQGSRVRLALSPYL